MSGLPDIGYWISKSATADLQSASRRERLPMLRDARLRRAPQHENGVGWSVVFVPGYNGLSVRAQAVFR